MKEAVNGLIKKQIPVTWLITMVVGILVWGLTLENRVDAMYDKGVTLRKDVETEIIRAEKTDEKLLDIAQDNEKRLIKICTSLSIDCRIE